MRLRSYLGGLVCGMLLAYALAGAVAYRRTSDGCALSLAAFPPLPAGAAMSVRVDAMLEGGCWVVLNGEDMLKIERPPKIVTGGHR